MKHDELRRKALARPAVRKAHAALEPEFALLKRMLSARKRAGLTQSEVARRMGTKAPSVARLERSLGSGLHSPSIQTLRKYAEAVGCHLDIKLVSSR